MTPFDKAASAVRDGADHHVQARELVDQMTRDETAAALTRGLQRHVMACMKHFAGNSIENFRFRVDVEVDERALHEVGATAVYATHDASESLGRGRRGGAHSRRGDRGGRGTDGSLRMPRGSLGGEADRSGLGIGCPGR